MHRQPRAPGDQLWVHPDSGRWYVIAIDRDLFGRAVALRWGGRGRPATGVRLLALRSMREGRRIVREVVARRRAHGYVRKRTNQ